MKDEEETEYSKLDTIGEDIGTTAVSAKELIDKHR